MKKHPLLRWLFIASLVAVIIQFGSTSVNLLRNPKDALLKQAEKMKEISPNIANQLEELAYEYDTNKYFQIMPYINFVVSNHIPGIGDIDVAIETTRMVFVFVCRIFPLCVFYSKLG
ncbi:MAG: hypothetical protein KatS3mg028_0476 [Bacteroidia bacterium]|nr:MAG: hypothetical protein KatS3mg028_0476 [Bacteroidia bacterium]